jgi:glycosyltransferase involved in cell wall biosynthesis
MALERPTGCLDAPAQGREVAGPAISVSGWVVFPNARTDFVEVFLDGERVGLAGLGDNRVDVLQLFSDEGVNALTSGFHAVVPVPISHDDVEHRVHVRATSYNGDIWEPASADFVVSGVKEKDLPSSPFASQLDPIQKATSTRPRWCVFTHSLKLGGGQLYLQELLLRVVGARAAEVLLISPEDGPLRKELEAEGISVHITAGYAVDPGKYEGGLVELAFLVREWRADIVVINTLAVFPPADAALRLGLPVIWAIHESFSLDVFAFVCWGPGGLAPAVRERWLLTLRSAELVYEADSTLELHLRDIPAGHAHKVPYGVDLDAIKTYRSAHDRAAMREQLGFGIDERILLCVGTLEDRKAQIPLLRAFVEAAVGESPARMVFVGGSDSPYARALKDSVKLLGAEDSVAVIDVDPDVYRWYLAADVLVSASDVESMPRSFLEAQAFGLPILAADVFGVGEVVSDGINGWLFRPRVASAMVAAVERVLTTSDTDLQRFSTCATACSAHYSGTGYAQAYINLASQLLEREAFGHHGRDESAESAEAING